LALETDCGVERFAGESAGYEKHGGTIVIVNFAETPTRICN
jgi:hypothetical protein